MTRPQLLAASALALVAAGWWFGYGAPASEYFRRQSRAFTATQPATIAGADSSASPPLITAARSFLLGEVPGRFSYSLYVSCHLFGLLPSPPKATLVTLETAGPTGGEGNEQATMDSAQVAQLAATIDSLLATARRLRAEKGPAVTLQTSQGEISLHLDAAPRPQPAVIIKSEAVLFDDDAGLTRLAALLRRAWSDCRAGEQQRAR